MSSRVNGVAVQFEKFDFLYGVMIGEIVLRLADNLSRTLQQKTLLLRVTKQQCSRVILLSHFALTMNLTSSEIVSTRKHMNLAFMNQFFHENAGLQQGLRKKIVILNILCLPLIRTSPYTLKP